MALQLRRARARTAEDLASTIRRFAEPLPPPRREEDFGVSFNRFGDATVVLLGEATHGTAEFYAARAAITRRLIEQHGFTIAERAVRCLGMVRGDLGCDATTGGPDERHP